MALLAACCFATSRRGCGGGCWRTRERPERECWVHSGCVVHTEGGWRWQMCAEEGAGCIAGVFCTRERPGRGCWVHSGCVLHTEGGWRWQMGAEESAGAHGSGRSESAGCTAGVFCTREAVGGGRCVQRRVLAHTGGGWWREMCAEEGTGAHRSDQGEGAGGTSGVFCTREAVGGGRWVRRRVLVHTGEARVRVLGA